MEKDLLNRIDRRLAAVGLNESAASKIAGLSDSAIRNFRRAVEAGKEAGLSTRTISALAPVLKTSAGWLLTGEGSEDEALVPIVGKAGAGPDGTVLFATGDGNFGEIPAPANSTASTEALEVQGDSMRGIANDGWIITYDDKRAPGDEHMGEPCVCWLENDRVLVKTPYPSREVGLFHLESANAATMRDVPVRYMALVTNIIPRKSAEKWVRRNPTVDVTDVKLAS